MGSQYEDVSQRFLPDLADIPDGREDFRNYCTVRVPDEPEAPGFVHGLPTYCSRPACATLPQYPGHSVCWRHRYGIGKPRFYAMTRNGATTLHERTS